MAKKIAIASKIGVSVKGVFEDFVVAQTAKGYTEKTIANYRSHFKSISRHIDIDRAFSNLTQADIDGMIVSMRESGLATNSISSYVRVFKTFMNWSRQQGYTTLTVPNYKQVETVKEPTPMKNCYCCWKSQKRTEHFANIGIGSSSIFC